MSTPSTADAQVSAELLLANREAFLKTLPPIHVYLEEKGSTEAVGALKRAPQ